MDTIHKKNGRLHIYVRQDKYKGELKSHNWVGRLYIDGKQKISSSGRSNLEEAIPILEKWFDDIHANKGKEEQAPQETTETIREQPSTPPEQTTPPVVETPKQTEPAAVAQNVDVPVENKEASEAKTTSSILEKFKNIKFKKTTFSKQDLAPKVSASGKSKFKQKIVSFLKARLGKKAVQGEEIVGVELTNKEIRLAQISTNKANQWILDKFFIHSIDLPDDASVLDNADKVSDELAIALQKSKIVTPNAAIAIPVTSAIIRVITAPLMNDEELAKAIDTNSLWENLVQLTDNLDDYSIFHQVINRNQKENTMDILFVASKLSDVNAYSSIAKKAGLNPVIMDVRCFTLKNAYDNTKDKSITDKVNSAILELGVDENYIMIIHNNIPIITDVFLRPQEKQSLLEITNTQIPNEADSVIRRYAMQIKTAIADYEGKYENKITSIQVVSSLKNIQYLIPVFKKNLPTTQFVNFDPLEGVGIPSYNSEKINQDNKSPLSSVLGLAYRKLDVFGYYKFVTAVKNINLLPNRDAIRQQNKLKFLSGFAFKGIAAAVAGIYLILIVLSFFQIKSNDEKLLVFDKIQMEFDQLNKDISKLVKEKRDMQKSLDLGKMINSNQSRSYRSLAQVTRSVPQRVQFTKIAFDGGDSLIIEGVAFSDQDILNFISNLNAKSLIEQASLVDMTILTGDQNSGSSNKKGFVINCKLKVT